MHGICYHASGFLIRPTPTHNNALQVILKISIFRFADPTILQGDFCSSRYRSSLIRGARSCHTAAEHVNIIIARVATLLNNVY